MRRSHAERGNDHLRLASEASEQMHHAAAQYHHTRHARRVERRRIQPPRILQLHPHPRQCHALL